ncbi:MAG: hypothetical protein ACOC44_09915 [Promethearchaeia archaeon]
MATQNSQTTEDLVFCKKCGGVMAKRTIVDKSASSNGSQRFMQIWQCVICRNWEEID